MEQEFEFIKNYENLYMINRNGEIKSCGKGIILKPQDIEDGYLWVKLSKYVNGEKERKKYRIHRLLALQYIPNPNNLPEVDHIDRNKKNNSLDNLRWVSRVENRRNRDDIIDNLNEEQKEERLNKIREYKKEWAEKDRRDKGMKIKAEMTLTKDPDYYAKWAKNKRANETPEQKEARLVKRREQYKNKEQSEEQKEKAKERARKQREKKKSLNENKGI